MLEEEVKLVCTGDLHLGRHPTKIPPEYDSRDLSPAVIWHQIVEKTIELEADALLISGDIVDRDNRYYEAFGPFEEGVRRLADNEISIYTVSGNHDFDVLPRLIDNIDQSNVYQLGKGGTWETQPLSRNGNAILKITGWSYPSRQYRKNPLSGFVKPDGDLPVIGMLHAEMDNPASNYAPVSSSELESFNVKGWVLGHIHKPFVYAENAPFILNPGSPQPLNPAEPGDHKVWEVILKQNGSVEINDYLLANLKYLELEIDVSDMEQIEKLPPLLNKRVEELLLPDKEYLQLPECAVIRLTLRGRTEISAEFEAKKEMLKDLENEVEGCPIVIDRIYNKTMPPVDLQELARGKSQAALVARYLIKLESGQELPDKLISEVINKLQTVYNSNAYQPLRRESKIDPPDRTDARDILTDQCHRLLEALLAQKEGA